MQYRLLNIFEVSLSCITAILCVKPVGYSYTFPSDEGILCVYKQKTTMAVCAYLVRPKNLPVLNTMCLF